MFNIIVNILDRILYSVLHVPTYFPASYNRIKCGNKTLNYILRL